MTTRKKRLSPVSVGLPTLLLVANSINACYMVSQDEGGTGSDYSRYASSESLVTNADFCPSNGPKRNYYYFIGTPCEGAITFFGDDDQIVSTKLMDRYWGDADWEYAESFISGPDGWAQATLLY